MNAVMDLGAQPRAADAALPLQLRLVSRQVLAQDIVGFEFADAGGAPLPAWTPGAHIELEVAPGLVRSYSLCGAQQPGATWRIAAQREAAGRGGSRALHDVVAAGAVLRAGVPRNLFPLADGAAHHLLLAGGIGITPLLAMAQALAARGQRFELHHATRSAARTPFVDTLSAPVFAGRVHWHHDGGDPAAGTLNLPALLATPQPGLHVYVCGPAGFIAAALAAARAGGWPDALVHVERFGAVPGEVANDEADQAFEVQLGRGGRVVAVPAGVSVLRALADAGVELMSSCEQGVCGTCVTRVLEGTPLHRDQYLEDGERAAGDCFTPCVSRACSPRLVLDL